MFSAGAESLIKQAREIQEDELQKFYKRISKLLHCKDYGIETVDSLQRLYLILSATKYTRSLPADILHPLQTLLCYSKSSEQLFTLSSAILRESTQCNLEDITLDDIQDSKTLSYLTTVILAQVGKQQDVSSLSQHVVRCLETRQPENNNSRCLLPILLKLSSLSPECLNEDQINVVSKKLVDWLRYASTQQGVPLSAGGFFTGTRTRQPVPITEVDGTVAADFFTVLCLGQSYTEDQWMNMHAFSMIRKWLLSYSTEDNSSADSDDRSEIDGSVMSMVSATSTSSRLLPPKERLREKSFEYCHRLIEQSDRKALKRIDAELQKACLIEAVTVMDIICREDHSYVYRAFPCVKALYGRINGDLLFSRALLPIAQFYLNHSETAAIDSEALYRQLFENIPPELFHDSVFAFEFIQFCRANVKVLSERVNVFQLSFPNLLKFLAWNSTTLLPEFIDLLPFLITTDKAVEILHTLLDLPCLTAVLDIQLRSNSLQASERIPLDQNSKVSSSMDAFRHPYYRGMFLYMLRSEAGTGDTIDRLNVLHEVLMDMAEYPRIVQCAQIVPILLHVFFNVIAQSTDKMLINQLILVLLERSSLLFDVQNYKTEVQRVFSSQFLVLCRLHPPLIVEQSKELLEFLGATGNIQNKENFFTYVVWAVGEYLSVSYDRRCTVEQITLFFETLEAVLFEITQVRQCTGSHVHNPRVITVLMTTLAKLASRSQDLIPRVSLCLSKMSTFAHKKAASSCYSEDDTEEIVTRANELINLLKLPSVAQFVLAPSMDGINPQWHRDTSAALPLVMRTMSAVLQRESGFSPALCPD
ncbi:AP-5 complex subunit zeta-1 [Erpetoichthys calabaricus]|uniref:Adaptor related protein complex 5 subunit zeta 1 n=1 Tax=Erpetoichthys calabaricus TaxID=27687 RepID=A0A8C4XF19_ERPCA|nr:AP-5 complex subunit zeta-1 [Erpetoichthys calabaricus]